jgi:hypothetical protein
MWVETRPLIGGGTFIWYFDEYTEINREEDLMGYYESLGIFLYSTPTPMKIKTMIL